MSSAFLWASIGILLIFLTIGLVAGLVRGLKRSLLHVGFLLLSLLIGYFVTKPITNAILGIDISINGSDAPLYKIIVALLKDSFDLTAYPAASEFLAKLPAAIVAPIVYLFVTLLVFLVFDIFYLIVARIAFNKKKVDFASHKPYRWYGAAIGALEGFVFMVFLFAPITSLTKTYAEITAASTTVAAQTTANVLGEQGDHLPTIHDFASDYVPDAVNDIISAYNNSVIGSICGAAGLHNAMFDGLSEISVNKQKVEIRKELVVLSDTYDDFVNEYNKFVDSEYGTIDLADLKTDVKAFLNGGLYKGVIAETVKDYVSTFKYTESLPQLVNNLLLKLKDVFSQETNMQGYLKHDLLAVFDAADTVFASGIIEEYQNYDNPDIEEILQIISDKSEQTLDIVDNLLGLNIIHDGFDVLGDYASERLEKAFENDDGYVVGLNFNVENVSETLDSAMDILDEFIKLNKDLPISSLLKDTDVLSALSDVDNLGNLLVNAGKIFDKLNSLEILVLPATETREEVHVFENILAIYDVSLLGDTVKVETAGNVQTKEIKTYEDFFTFISEPINDVQQLNLLEFADGKNTLDDVIDGLLEELSTDEKLFAKLLMPFYQLEKATFNSGNKAEPNLRAMVFDKMIDELDKNVNEIDFSKINQDDYSEWTSELTLLGRTLNSLNRGQVETTEGNKTYIKYILTNNFDMMKLLRSIVKEDSLSNILRPVIEAKVFEPLVDKIFDEIDSAVSDMTGAEVESNLATLRDTEDSVVSVLEEFMDFAINTEDISKVKLQEIGAMLNAIKDNAKGTMITTTQTSATANANAEPEKYYGVFNEIFKNLIWYMTGDNIANEAKYSNPPTNNKNYKQIKAQLDVANSATGYYEIDYEEKMETLDDMVELYDSVKDVLGDEALKQENIPQIVDKLEEALNDVGTEEDQKELIDKAKDILDKSNDTLLSEQDIQQHKEEIEQQLKDRFGENSSVTESLLDLLGLKEQQP